MHQDVITTARLVTITVIEHQQHRVKPPSLPKALKQSHAISPQDQAKALSQLAM